MADLSQKQKVAAPAKSDYRQGQYSDNKMRMRKPHLNIGHISRVIPGTYMMTASVMGEAIPEVQCIYVPGMMSPLFGVKDCSMPVEGTPVLLLTLPQEPRKRLALCSLPDELKGFSDLESLDYLSMFGSSAEPGVDYWSVDSYINESNDKKKLAHIPTNSDRPWTMLPGEWGQGNPMGVFMAVQHFMATMKATERAKIETFVLDDLVRVTAGQYQHWGAFGDLHEYTDGGWSSMELEGSHFQPETRGYDTMSEMVISDGKSSENEERAKPADSKTVMKRRFRMFFGALGDMFQVYLRNVTDGVNPATDDSQESWGASFKMHLDNSGALNVASASGIGISLNPNMPVPKRMKDAWDPEGDNLEDDEELFKKKVPFDYGADTPDKYPYLRNIKAIWGEAYEDGKSYQRFDELKKDFKTPELNELQPVKDVYDSLGSDGAYSKYPGRRAGMRVEQDGSLRLWDNWGSEIYMRGGDIVLSCAGRILMQPGKGIVGMSRDVVFKAKNSMDLTAETNDIRLAAGKNLMAHTTRGGMLFEAGGTMEGDYSGTGEETQAGGIIFKADKSSVVLWGRRVVMLGDYVVARLKQSFILAADKLLGVFKTVLLETEGKSGLSLDAAGAELFGPGINIAGAESVNVLRGTDAMIPMQWAPVQFNAYESMTGMSAQYDNMYREKDAWIAPYTDVALKNVKFTYRTSEQCGTATGAEVSNAGSQFRIYQSRWQFLMANDHPFIEGALEKWVETKVNDTYPWPGAESRNAAYVSVMTGMEFKNRADLESSFTAPVAQNSMDEYSILSK